MWGRRINEDLHLLQELSDANAVDEIWNAWSRFWQKAVEDHGAEYSHMAELAAGLVPNGITLSTPLSDTATARPQSKAA